MKNKLREILNNSYAPLSKYHVACIVECENGETYEGVNVETSSPAAGICAERNAIYNMIAHGQNKIKTIYIMNKTEKECYPCFICRQTLVDFCQENTIIKTYNYSGTIEKEITVKQLCPYPFSTKDLEEE